MSACRSGARRGLLLAVALLAAGSATAQDEDPLFEDSAQEPEIGGWRFTPYGDLHLRHDRVTGLVGREVDRLRTRARGGLRFADTERWELALAVEAAKGNDSDRDNRRNNDNERSDQATLDEAYVRFTPTESTVLTLGQTAFPLTTTPLTWDRDLRPIGFSASQAFALDGGSRIELVGGWFRGNHLYGDESEISAVQVGWTSDDTRSTRYGAHLGWLRFDELERAAREGLMRTNRRIGTRLVSDFELVDLVVFAERDLDGVPLRATLDLVHNTGARDQDDGIRGSLVYGDLRRPGGWEVGLSAQRIQRDAVPAAFNEDDWWFHSFARGAMPWVGYGFDEHWSLRVAGFYERRDDQDERVQRLLIDLRGEW